MSVNGYLQLWLACLLLSAYCCWRLYLCRSQGWAEHSPRPTGFVYSEFSWTATATSFPLSKHTEGGDTAPTFSGRCVCLQLTWEVGLLLSLLWSFPPTTTVTSFPAPGCWACATAPAFSGPACLFTVLWGIPLPALMHSGCPTIFATCLYYSYCLLLSFSFFPWMGVSLSGGLCWSGPGLSVGVLHTA
jgi:hypothetical protein